MLIKQYIELKYENQFELHKIEHCMCDLAKGEKGLCIYGQYLEGIISAKDFLKGLDDKYHDLEYGTFIRTISEDVARIIGVIKLGIDVYFKLDREVMIDRLKINNKSNIIPISNVDEHSNKLKDLVREGDVVNGKRIISITEGRMCYGRRKDQCILGEITELLTQNEYNNHVVLS